MQETFYGDKSWKAGLPWLYYSQTPKQVFKEKGPIDLVVSFEEESFDGSRSNKLKFWLARYSMNGEFEAMQRLNNELSPCPIDMQEVQAMLTFGVVSELSCSISLIDLVGND